MAKPHRPAWKYATYAFPKKLGRVAMLIGIHRETLNAVRALLTANDPMAALELLKSNSVVSTLTGTPYYAINIHKNEGRIRLSADRCQVTPR